MKTWEKFPGPRYSLTPVVVLDCRSYQEKRESCDPMHAVSFLQCHWSNCAETSEKSATMNTGGVYLALICMVVRSSAR